MVLSRLLRLNSIFTYKPQQLTQSLVSLLATDLQPSRSLSFSTSAALPHTCPPPPDTTPTLSSRMSFVFDQIDAIHRQRNADVDDKDEALQRIRAWRHSKQQKREEGEGGRVESNEVETKLEVEKEEEGVGSVIRKEVEMVHPWPEWIEFMERLLQQNYLDHRRLDEDRMVENVPGIDLEGLSGIGVGDGDGGFDEKVGLEFWRDWVAVCTACKNFGHDRFDIFKSLSRKDIQVLVGYGCPSLDGKVVYSAKLLRKHAHVNEGDVCSACTLRSSCKKGFLLVRKEDEARTLDIMRILLTFGFDPINGSVKNRPLMKMKSVKTVVRKLLYEIVKLSAVPIDPNLPRPVIKKPTPKVKQAPPPPKKRVGRDDVEMKKGDWLCAKCDFMNFAKNTVCLQCDAKRPKRQLLPGEWECPECNFLNYRRNMACFHCECKRPQDEFTENQVHAKQHEPRNRPTGNVRMPNVSDAWNFDFDENESDGADVAAFEFADPPRRSDGGSEKLSHKERHREYSDECDAHEKELRSHKRGGYFSDSDERNITSHASRTGFDDFDDEEDDVDSYEIDTAGNNKTPAVSRKRYSELENASESEEFDNYNHSMNDDGSLSNSKVFHSVPRIKTHRDKFVSYGSDDDDIDLHSDSDDKFGKRFTTNMGRGSNGIPDQKNTVPHNQRSGRTTSRNSIENNDVWHSRGRQRTNHGAIRDDFSSNMGHNKRSGRVNYERSDRIRTFEHNHRQNDQGRRVNNLGGRKRNDRRDDSSASSRPFERDRFGSSRSRSNEFGNKSTSEERPRRRVIER